MAIINIVIILLSKKTIFFAGYVLEPGFTFLLAEPGLGAGFFFVLRGFMWNGFILINCIAGRLIGLAGLKYLSTIL